MNCIFTINEKSKEIERIMEYLNSNKSVNSVIQFISNECGLPNSLCLYERDFNIKKDRIKNYFGTIYDDNLAYIKKKREIAQKFWEKNKDKINIKLKNIWGKYFLDEEYEIRLNISRSQMENLDDKIYDVCYKLTKQALLEECIYFLNLKSFNNFFNEKLSAYNSTEYKKLKMLFGQIVANILLRSALLNEYKNRYPKDPYLLKIKCNKKELLETTFEIFCNNSFETSLISIWEIILKNSEELNSQIKNIII